MEIIRCVRRHTYKNTIHWYWEIPPKKIPTVQFKQNAYICFGKLRERFFGGIHLFPRCKINYVNIIMFNFDLFMSTCNMIMSICDLNYVACDHINLACWYKKSSHVNTNKLACRGRFMPPYESDIVKGYRKCTVNLCDEVQG